MNLSRKIIIAGLLATVAACAPKPPPPPPPPPPEPEVIPPRPLPPGNASLTQILPARDVEGRFVTANSNVTGDRAYWQLKIGLNVAAIGCRGVEEPTLVAAYNDIIKNHAKTIRATEKAVISQLSKETGTNGVAARDRMSTQLFNYFAQPPAQRAFCPRANEIAQLVSTTPAAQIVEQAPALLARLDEPFHDFYEAYAKYQADVVAWDTKYGALYGQYATPSTGTALPAGMGATLPTGAAGPVDPAGASAAAEGTASPNEG
ncbi:hypothetical protein [Sphingopyxis sp. MWB1]|uniref:hypothetical protein n=1 Tax=Sphingopyxis sp. MWB1 TaxID=1537715 RepID=UPI000B03EFEA|nr:hypothetical protein [Sphingopyxis sp. MWB1]